MFTEWQCRHQQCVCSLKCDCNLLLRADARGDTINKQVKHKSYTLHTAVIQESLVFLLHSNLTFQGTQQEDYNNTKKPFFSLLILIDISEHVFAPSVVCVDSPLWLYVGQNVCNLMVQSTGVISAFLALWRMTTRRCAAQSAGGAFTHGSRSR